MTDRPPLAPGDFISVVQALAFLPISRALLYRLVGQNQIRAIRVASLGSTRGRLLIERRSLEDYVARRLAAATTPVQVKLNPDEILARIRRREGTPTGCARAQRRTGGCGRGDAPECASP